MSGARKRPTQAKSVELPVLVNVKEVIEGAELLLFRQKVEKKRVVDERSKWWADAEPSAKKPRVGGGGERVHAIIDNQSCIG